MLGYNIGTGFAIRIIWNPLKLSISKGIFYVLEALNFIDKIEHSSIRILDTCTFKKIQQRDKIAIAIKNKIEYLIS